MSNTIYQDKSYLLTKDEFTYKGTKEPIQKVKGLYLIENDNKRKIINGSVWGFIMLAIALIFTPMLSFVVMLDGSLVWLINYFIPIMMMLMGFGFNYFKTKDFALEIEKSSGNKGIIDRSNSKESFEHLIKVFNATKHS